MSAASPPGNPDFIRVAKDKLRAGDGAGALSELRRGARPSDVFPRQAQYVRIARAAAALLPPLPPLRVAVLAGSTVSQWVDCLELWTMFEGYQLNPHVAAFDTWRQEVMDPSSQLYAFAPDVIWLFLTTSDLRLSAVPGASEEEVARAVAAAVDDVASCVRSAAARGRALVLVNNAVPPVDRTFGNYEGGVPWSPASMVRRYNVTLAPALPVGSAVFDVEHQAARFGLERWEDARLRHHSKHPFALDASGPMAFAGARLLSAARGRARKCLAVDLDNTLWGGIVGDDGVDGIRVGPDGGAVGEAFVAFQTYLKSLADRGIALAVCSKNDEAVAREAFRARSEMVLRLEDFAAFRANWNDKATNLRDIAAELNLGLDSFVFVDDNPAERELVRGELPQVAVPEMPGDPADYVRSLAGGAWFETLAFSEEDRRRTRTYRENGARSAAQAVAVDLRSYLRDLEMRSAWGPADAGRMPRIAQLVNKTNQFHMTGTRYSEADVVAMAHDPASWVGWFGLRDRFGDHGLIAVVILRFKEQVAVVDTWAMSCRVFARGMEEFTFKALWGVAQSRGARALLGRYRATPRNGVASTVYARLGGAPIEGGDQETRWRFDLSGERPALETFVTDDSDAV